jgi:hypothetical protein
LPPLLLTNGGGDFRSKYQHNQKTVYEAADLCLARPVRGRITLRSSAEYLEQLGVRLDRTDTSEPIPSKSRVAVSEAIREIAWESDLRFA